MQRPVVVVAGRHRPHEQLLLAYGALTGAIYLLDRAPEPTSLVSQMPSWVVTAWSAGLVVAGIVGVTGCWLRGERGLRLEAAGLLIGTGALVLYTAAAIGAAGLRAIWPAGLVAAWAVANIWRAVQCHRDLRQLPGDQP